MRWAHRLLGLIFAAFCVYPPLTLVAHICGVPLATAYVLAAPGLVVASVIGVFFPRRYRIAGVIALAAVNVLAALWLDPGNWLSMLVVLVMMIAQLSTLAASAGFDQNPGTLKALGVGAILYAGAYVAFFFLSEQELLSTLGIVCVVYLIYGAILINLNAVSDASHIARRVEARPPSALRAGNLLLTLLIIGVALALMNIGVIKDAFIAATGNILMFILWLLSLGGGEESSEAEGEGGGGMGGLPEIEDKQMPAWLEAALNMLLYTVTALVLIALAVLLCVAVYRGLRKLIAIIRKWLGAQGREAAYDIGYTDERTKLARWQVADTANDPKKSWIERLMYRPPKWKDLSNRERVRYALTQMLYLERRYEADRTRTAREIIFGMSFLRRGSGDSEGFAEAYDRARYSDAEITDADAENARLFLRGEK